MRLHFLFFQVVLLLLLNNTMITGSTSLCYLIVVIISIGFLIWGFMDLLRKRQHSETTETQVISRQIRGAGLLLLSQVILILGIALCSGGSRSKLPFLGMD